MSKITSYDILLEIQKICNRLEDKVDKRFVEVEKRVNVIEDFQANLTGKITVLGAVIMLVVNFLWDFGMGLIKKIN